MLWVKAVVSTCFRLFLSHRLPYTNSSCGKIKNMRANAKWIHFKRLFIVPCNPFSTRTAALRPMTNEIAATATTAHKQLTHFDTMSDDVMMLFL